MPDEQHALNAALTAGEVQRLVAAAAKVAPRDARARARRRSPRRPAASSGASDGAVGKRDDEERNVERSEVRRGAGDRWFHARFIRSSIARGAAWRHAVIPLMI